MVTNDDIHRSFEIVDSTLRDGEQTAGVVFSVNEKKAVAQKLALSGVAEIEVGSPAIGEEEMNAISAIVEMDLSCRITGWCRANDYDLDCARVCGLESVHISLPVSGIHIEALDKSSEWVKEQVVEFVTKARTNFNYVSLGMQDASRADIDFIIELAELAESSGADRIRLADTVGIWEPMRAFEVVSKIRAHTEKIAIGFHAHNDLGMATANCIAAIRAGADSVDVTVNGLGDRAGNASMDEVVMAAGVSLGIDCGVDSKQLLSLATLVENISGRKLPVNKPITGKEVFLHESGIHVHAMLKDRRTYEPFDPESIGRQKSEFVLGKHSGRAALRHVLAKQGLNPSKSQESMLLGLIQKSAMNKKETIFEDSLPAMGEAI